MGIKYTIACYMHAQGQIIGEMDLGRTLQGVRTLPQWTC